MWNASCDYVVEAQWGASDKWGTWRVCEVLGIHPAKSFLCRRYFVVDTDLSDQFTTLDTWLFVRCLVLLSERRRRHVKYSLLPEVKAIPDTIYKFRCWRWREYIWYGLRFQITKYWVKTVKTKSGLCTKTSYTNNLFLLHRSISDQVNLINYQLQIISAHISLHIFGEESVEAW